MWFPQVAGGVELASLARVTNKPHDGAAPIGFTDFVLEHVMTWFEHHKEQALIQGRAEGRAETLCKLLVLKFGAIDSEHEARIAASLPMPSTGISSAS